MLRIDMYLRIHLLYVSKEPRQLRFSLTFSMTGKEAEQNCHRGAEGEEGVDCALSVPRNHVIVVFMATDGKS